MVSGTTPPQAEDTIHKVPMTEGACYLEDRGRSLRSDGGQDRRSGRSAKKNRKLPIGLN